MSELQERNEYSKKLESQIKGIDELIALPSSVITPSIIEELKKIRNKAVKCKRKIDTGEFEIAIIGLEKSGKSTFANAIIGSYTLPVASERCTYTSSSISYGEKDHAVVEFLTSPEFYKDFNDKLRIVGIKNYKTLSFENLTKDRYADLFKQDADKEHKEKYETTLNKDIENILENKESISYWLDKPAKDYYNLEDPELKEFISSPKVSVAAKQITIQTSELKGMTNAILFDVPGFDSPTAMHKEQTKKFMREADAVLFVARGNEPTIKGPDGNLFAEYVNDPDDDGTTLAEKLFTFANKTDGITAVEQDLANEIVKNSSILFNGLREYCKVSDKERIVMGSAYAYLEKIGKVKNLGLGDKLANAGYDDGIEKMRNKLIEYNSTERFSILKKRINRIQTEIENLFSDILENNKDIDNRNVSSEERFDIQEDLLDQKTSIIQNLNDLWSEIKKDLSNRPLSDALTTKLGVWLCEEGKDNSQLDNFRDFQISKYEVSDEEIKRAAIDCGNDDGGYNLKDIDVALRTDRIESIKNGFNKLVIDLAISEHSKYDVQIKEILTNGLSISENNPFYDEINENINKYLRDIKKNIEYNGYYKSLIDRFSINIIELLIRRPFELERKTQYFDVQKDNFFMLASVDDGKDDDCPINAQPLFSLILKHEDKYIKETNWKSVFDTIKKYVKVPDNLIKPLIKQFIPFGDVPIVNELVDNCLKAMLSDDTTDEQKLSTLQNNLKRQSPAQSNKPGDDFESFYKQHKIESLENIQQILNDDIKILNYVLIHVVVKAISLETPFKTLENDFIQNIKQDIEKPNRESLFKKFIKLNLNKIAYDKLKDITRKEEEMKRISDAVRIIKEILSNIKSNTWEE